MKLNHIELEKTSFRNPTPLLKWAGGKKQMLDILINEVPQRYNKYIEPFIGGGALFFELQNENSIISDSNEELINLYKIVASDVESLIEHLKAMQNTEEFFYSTRSQNIVKLTCIERAARMIYLNKTCFNGLYRVNRKGEFNVPYGHYVNPNICDETNLRSASQFLKKVKIVHGDYKVVLKENAQAGDFVFLDPPYLPMSKYSDFKRYTKEQFYEEDQRELAEEVDRLHDLGCYVLLTNSNHPLVHELYSKYEISIYNTKRYISSNSNTRTGQDVLVKIKPKKIFTVVRNEIVLPDQMNKFPPTRYMGSKQKLIKNIWNVASQFKFNSVLDLFSGSGVVSYMFKTQGKQVFSNDYMTFSATFSEALIENNTQTLSKNDINILLNENSFIDDFVSTTFKDLYFTDEDNQFIDLIRKNIHYLSNKKKKALAMSALIRACMKKRARGIFTYVGLDSRYDDGRRDLSISFKQQFLEAVELFNDAVFDNGQDNKVRNGDAMDSKQKADLVYIDPPYFSPLSDNEYVRRYHFVEGLARDWKGVDIQWHTKTKKIKSYPTPFSSQTGAKEAFDKLFKKHKDSIIMVSYSSNSLPTKEEILGLLSQYKNKVHVVEIDHRYSFGNQGNKVNDNKNRVEEYLFVAY